MPQLTDHKDVGLFLILGGFFISNALLAELIGGKLFSVEIFFRVSPFNLELAIMAIILTLLLYVIHDFIDQYLKKNS